MKQQILATILVMGHLIAGCGGSSDDVTETPKINNYTEWTALLKNPSHHHGTGNPVRTLEDGRIIIGYREGPTNLQGRITSIAVLPSSYATCLEEFKIEDLDDNSAHITLNESIEDKPDVAIYIPKPKGLNKEYFQNEFNKTFYISFIRNRENPINIPFKLIQTPEDECWFEFSTIGSGRYLIEDPSQQQ